MSIWDLVSRQHGVIARRQLLELGMSVEAIRWRIREARLHPIHRGVSAVGRPEPTQAGGFMAAVLACGHGAVLSHSSAAAHWKIRRAPPTAAVHTSLDAAAVRRPAGVKVHRTRTLADRDLTFHRGIPIATPARTLIDLASVLGRAGSKPRSTRPTSSA